MIGRADIEGSKSNVAMGAWLPQASSLIPRDLMLSFPTALTSPPLGVSVFLLPLVTISSGSSMYLRPCKDPHLTMRWTAQCLTALPESAADHPIPWTVSRTPQSTARRGVISSLGVRGSKDFPASRCVASALSSCCDHVQQRVTVPNSTDVSVLPNLATMRIAARDWW